MLTLYRRHLKACPQKNKGRTWKRCKCPIWVQGTHFGVPIRESLKTESWEEAEHRISEMRKSPVKKQQGAKLISEAAEVYLSDLAVRVSAETVRKHRNFLQPLIQYGENTGKRYLQQIEFSDLVTFRAGWPDSPLSASKKLERLKTFFRFCFAAKWIPTNPAEHLKRPVFKDNPTLPFTQEQVAALIEACKTKYTNNYGLVWQNNAKRLLAFMLVLRYTGLRIRDAVQLKQEQVKPGRVFLYQQKTGEPVVARIPNSLYEMLAELPDRTSDVYYFWTGNGNPKSAVGDWQRSFRKLFKLAGFEGHPHQFRDTLAVEMLAAGKSMESVQAILGHSSIKTTEKHYAPWVKSRQARLDKEMEEMWENDPILDLVTGTSRVRDL